MRCPFLCKELKDQEEKTAHYDFNFHQFRFPEELFDVIDGGQPTASIVES